MTARWGICACLSLVLALSAGCRTPQPNLKPAPEKEAINDPPSLPKYASGTYPEQAFDKMTDPDKQALDANKLPAMGGRSGGSMGTGSMMGSGR